jgi:hypothetical protein
MAHPSNKCAACNEISLLKFKYCSKHQKMFDLLESEFTSSNVKEPDNDNRTRTWKDFLIEKKKGVDDQDIRKVIDVELLIPEGYELINGEYVRNVSFLTSKNVEKFVEGNVIPFFSSIGFDIAKIPRSQTKRVDYQCQGVGIEVTALHDYFPKNEETDRLLQRHNETNSRICAYMFLKDGKPTIEILNEIELKSNYSILCLRQHVSYYRPKLINKIKKKYDQDNMHNLVIVVIDFRLAHFDSLSLKTEIKSILNEFGNSFPKLAGILAAIPKKVDSEMLHDSEHVFIRNPGCIGQHEILEKLKNYLMAKTSYWITIDYVFVKFTGKTIIPNPCIDCPGRQELNSRGLPTFQVNTESQ